MDKLERIVQEQSNLFEIIAEEHNVDFENNNNMMINHLLAINAEVGELQKSLDWKWWTNEMEIDWNNVDEELIDILFFTIQALVLHGHDAESIYNMYLDKLEINHERQEGKYRKGYKADSGEKYEEVD